MAKVGIWEMQSLKGRIVKEKKRERMIEGRRYKEWAWIQKKREREIKGRSDKEWVWA